MENFEDLLPIGQNELIAHAVAKAVAKAHIVTVFSVTQRFFLDTALAI
ncbi:MAG: hypothetical protein HQL73_12450 [Magnetococcales bacterium]|nr:hypothetical protein [Magnetococcales bacterium]